MKEKTLNKIRKKVGIAPAKGVRVTKIGMIKGDGIIIKTSKKKINKV